MMFRDTFLRNLKSVAIYFAYWSSVLGSKQERRREVSPFILQIRDSIVHVQFFDPGSGIYPASILQLVCRVSAVLIAKKLPAEDTVLSQNLSTILLNLTIDLSTHAISPEIVFAGALAKASRIPNLAVTQNQRKLWPIIVFTRSIQD